MQRAEPEKNPPSRVTILPRRGATRRAARGWLHRLFDPQSAVLVFLALLLLLGGGRRWYLSLRARRAAGRLGMSDVTPQEIEEMAGYGREGLIDLFRLLGTAPAPECRVAAGKALAKLWKDDQLIPEEEKAIVSRGLVVSWKARRRYPRSLRAPIRIEATRSLPFLGDFPGTVSAANLEWSHRIAGSRRVSLESFSPWNASAVPVRFEIEPADFPTDGPHRLVLHLRVRTTGLTSTWELDLPQIPLSFDFDPFLEVDSLLATPDSTRAELFAKQARLAESSDEGEPRYLDLSNSLTIRNPPALVVETPLPSDLAHAIYLEFEGAPGRFPAGSLVLAGQAAARAESNQRRSFPITLSPGVLIAAVDRPGSHRLRLVLEAAPELGWADPDVRSIWPGSIVTDWAPIEVLRR
jgi:hypothetical protein